MRKIFLMLAALASSVMLFAADSSVTDLVKFVPEGTNVILYVNASRLMGTKFLKAMRQENVKFGHMVDGVEYHEERLGIKGQAVKNLLLCRDTSKATASFYLLNTIVPEDKFAEVFVADYAFFIESSRVTIEFGPRKKQIPYFELIRKRSPEQKYGAVYLGSNPSDGNYIVTIVPLDYVKDTLEALQNPPISGEVATVAGHSMDGKAIAWMVASLKNKGQAFSSWDKMLDGLVFAEITFNLIGEQEDIAILARFYSDSTEGRGLRTAGSAARFISELRREKEAWLDSIFDSSNESLREKVSKSIAIYLREGNVILDVNMPAALYEQLCEVSPHVAITTLSTLCEKFQLVEPEMLVGSDEIASTSGESEISSGLFD